MRIITDNINTLPAKSVAAAIALVSVNTLCHPTANGTEGTLDVEQADTLVQELIRVSRGPIALLLVNEADAWADVLTRHGLTVSRGSYLLDTIDLIIGSAGPIKMPSTEAFGLRELIDQVTKAISPKGSDVLVPVAGISTAAMAIQSAGREPIILPLTVAHAEQIRADFAGEHFTAPLDDETYASVLARMGSGEALYSIARTLGIGTTRLRKRLLRDGYSTCPDDQPKEAVAAT